MTKNEKYWQARTAQRMWEHMQSAEETADQVAKVYAKASLYLSREMQDIFKKYVEKHHLTEKEALQLLNTLRDRTSIEELRQRLQSSSQKQEIADLLAELEAPAYQARIQRLQELQTQIDLVMQQVYKQEQAIATAHYIQLAGEAYNRSVFDIQQRTEFGFSFAHIDQKQVDKVLKSKWSGMNYSERVWRNTRALAQEVKEALLVNLITGRTEREAAEMLTKKFAGGSSKARRLIRTESCYLSNQLEMESYKECGIDKYQYLATLDLRTSEICRELDGKVFLVKDQQPGKNCPPMHPWCRSTTIAIIGEKMLEGMKRRARDPVTGKTYLVPASMNYREWYAKYVKSDGKTVAKEAGSGIIEMTRKADDPRANLKFISDTTFDNLTISAKKKGALIIRGTKEAEEHLEKVGAAASTMGDILIFRKDVCISEVLEETHHFEQNFAKMNDDKGEPLRTILNEIDAKQYLLDNAAKYKIPRNELELTQKQLESYQKQLETYKKGGRWE